MTLRRDFLAMTAGAVTARAGLPMAGRAKAQSEPSLQHPDADLLAVAAEAEECEATIYRIDRANNTTPEAYVLSVINRSTELEQRLMAMRPVTAEGFRAKARVVRAVMQNLIVSEPDKTMEEMGEFVDLMAWSLVHDVLAMGAG
jgi:hypothetical protein